MHIDQQTGEMIVSSEIWRRWLQPRLQHEICQAVREGTPESLLEARGKLKFHDYIQGFAHAIPRAPGAWDIDLEPPPETITV